MYARLGMIGISLLLTVLIKCSPDHISGHHKVKAGIKRFCMSLLFLFIGFAAITLEYMFESNNLKFLQNSSIDMRIMYANVIIS
ncbi:hypothetical protein PMAYCL1PPCAC_09931, partial [Pristionchus mayeri]